MSEFSLYICSSFTLIFSASSLDILYKYCSEIKFNTPLNISSFFKEYTSFFGLGFKHFSNTLLKALNLFYDSTKYEKINLKLIMIL